MNETLESKIRQCSSLPSLPVLAMQVVELVQKGNADIAEIAKIISKDPAMSSKILRTVNSSFYKRSQTVSTISHALVILGLQSVKTLVLGFSLTSNLPRAKSAGFDHVYYWRRSVYAATAARVCATRMLETHSEEAFLSALLMDIGILVMDQVVGEQYGPIYKSAASHAQLPAAELKALGMSHADAAGVLASQWKLPPMLSTPMTSHHRPESVGDPLLRRLTDIVACASLCADVFVDKDPHSAMDEVHRFVMAHWKISAEECDKMLEEINGLTHEMATLFDVVIEPTSLDAILKRASETLVELTLSSQQQAVALEVQNQQLKKQAATDVLTGLANRAEFDHFLLAKFGAALEQEKPLAIIMLDLDKFKTINDVHGHPCGDQVLVYMGRLMRAVARTTDLAARYGGEEMVLILPNTTRSVAAGVAEKLRRAIAAKPIPADGQAIAVTASFGIAVYEPGCPFREAAHLIKAADLALYAAKNAGRNCVKVFSLKSAKPTATEVAA